KHHTDGCRLHDGGQRKVSSDRIAIGFPKLVLSSVDIEKRSSVGQDPVKTCALIIAGRGTSALEIKNVVFNHRRASSGDGDFLIRNADCGNRQITVVLGSRSAHAVKSL